VKHDQQVFLYGKYCGGLKILIFNWAGLQILPNGKGISHADCKSLYSIGQDCKSCPTTKDVSLLGGTWPSVVADMQSATIE
jgi:hypothetical protein